VEFGRVALGSFGDRPFVAQNASGGTVTVTASTSGPFGVVSGSPSTLGVGESRTVTVRFSPTVPASATANVNFSADGDTISVIVTGSGADSTAPTVAITAPTAGPTYSTSGSPLTLPGTAADKVGVTQVAWVNSAGGSGAATGTTSWTAGGIVLQPGTNALTVTAGDGAGNTATATLTVTLIDATAPTLAITTPTAGSTY